MLTVKTPEEALLTLEAAFPPRPSPEEVPLGQARGRILFAPVVASEYVPGFDRSTVDGYAVRSADTFGCSDAIPAILKLRGEILMGTGAEEALESGCCVAVPTGGAMPPGCDAVVMVEDVIRQEDGTVRLYASAAPWQHIRQIGEDVCAGEMILGSRAVISPAAIGAMLAAGVLEAEVLRRPVVGIIPTGDEIVPPTADPKPGDIVEFNSSIFSAMLTQWGAEPRTYPIVPDRREAILEAVRTAPQGEPCQEAVLSRAVVSGLKYQEFVRVRLGRVGGKLMASPLSRGSGVVSSFMRADGILTVPQGVEGYEAGSRVAVRLLRPAHELENTLVSIGSHDPLLDEAADLLHLADPSLCMSSTHVGSMGGIMAVRRGETHIAGVHLLDEGDGSYNAAFIRRYFPSGGVRLVECVGRTQGLMLPPGNPLGAAAGGAGERGLPGAPGEAGGLPAGHEPGQLGRPGGGQLRRAAGGRGAGDDKAPRGADFPHSGGLSGPGQPGRRVCPAHSFS